MGKEKVRKLLLVSATALTAAVGVKAIDAAAADPADSVAVDEIDYEDLTLTIKANPGDTQVLFAKSKTAKTWDAVPGELSGENKITADISWVSVSKDTTLYFKGDKSTEPVAVTLPKQNKKFKAVFDPITNSVNFQNRNNNSSDGSAAQSTIYWRKSKSTTWEIYDKDKTPEQFPSFAMKGATLYFQEGQVKGTPGNAGARPSKASSLKISKRAGAPKVSLDYSKRTFKTKTTMEYRTASKAWTPVESTALSLKDALPEALIPTTDADQTVSIDFRTKATSRKVASQIYTVKVPVQEVTPTGNVNLFYMGSQQCKIVISKETINADSKDALEAASSKNPYEYTVVKPDEKNQEGRLEDASSVSWTAITKEETPISNSVAPDGSYIYIRKKATKDKLATGEVRVNGSKALKYPTAATLDQSIVIKRIQGTTDNNGFSLPLGYGKDDIDSNQAENIKITSITHNGRKIGFKAEKTVLSEEKYSIPVSIVDTQSLETDDYFGKDLPLKIILNNGDIIGDGKEEENREGANENTNKSPVMLHIIKKAGIEPSNKNYTKYVKYNFDSAGIAFTVKPNASAEISSISYNGKSLEPGDYTITKAASGNAISVTIKQNTVDGFQNAEWVKTSEYGKTNPLVVTLEYKDADLTGEKETINAAGLKVDYPVNVSADASSIGVLESACTGSAIIDPEITYTVSDDFCKTTGFEVQSADLTWNGTDVLGGYSYTASNRTVKVKVRLAKLPGALKKENVDRSAPLTITLHSSNKQELIVDYGYYITLIQ